MTKLLETVVIFAVSTFSFLVFSWTFAGQAFLPLCHFPLRIDGKLHVAKSNAQFLVFILLDLFMHNTNLTLPSFFKHFHYFLRHYSLSVFNLAGYYSFSIFAGCHSFLTFKWENVHLPHPLPHLVHGCRYHLYADSLGLLWKKFSCLLKVPSWMPNEHVKPSMSKPAFLKFAPKPAPPQDILISGHFNVIFLVALDQNLGEKELTLAFKASCDAPTFSPLPIPP